MLVCQECGSDQVWCDAWVDINTMEIVNTFDNWWCEGHEGETKPIEEEKYKKGKT